MSTYSIDPKKLTLNQFFSLIRTRKLLPGRKILRDSAKDRCKALQQEGIENLNDLFTAMKNKDGISDLSHRTGIPGSYLVLLKREAGSYISKKVNLSDFPGIPYEFIKMLESKGIKNSRQLLDTTGNTEQRKMLSKETGIPIDRIEELECLSDLARINGIGGKFARIIFEAGIHSVKDFTEMDILESYREFKKINTLNKYTTSFFRIDDIQYCLHFANVLYKYASTD